MPNIFLIADTHFGHANMCNFLRTDGTKLRPWDDADEMDQAMIDNWNRVVQPTDKVYHLGDVFLNQKKRHLLSTLNGTKVLIRGNHDTFKLTHYSPFFKDVRGYHLLDKILLSHIPVHPDSISFKVKGNVHGHLHEGIVKDALMQPDRRYMTVCVEHINYTPIEFSVVQKYFNKS